MQLYEQQLCEKFKGVSEAYLRICGRQLLASLALCDAISKRIK